MSDPLCRFGHTFPRLAAQILHRDRGKTGNFREKTITDLIMAGLTAFEPFVRLDFPADEFENGGGHGLRAIESWDGRSGTAEIRRPRDLSQRRPFPRDDRPMTEMHEDA